MEEEEGVHRGHEKSVSFGGHLQSTNLCSTINHLAIFFPIVPQNQLPRSAATDSQPSSLFADSRVNYGDEIIEPNVQDKSNLVSIRINLQDPPAPAHDEQDVVQFPLQKAHGSHLAHKFNNGVDSPQRLFFNKAIIFPFGLAIPNHDEISICSEDTNLR